MNKKLIVIGILGMLLFTMFSTVSGIKVEDNQEIKNMSELKVKIVHPENGERVHGYSVNIYVRVESEHGVDRAEFYIDSNLMYTGFIRDAYELFWDTTKVSNGYHEIMVIVYDTPGNSASDSVLANSMYASSTTTTPLHCSRTSTILFRERRFPVGLFGEQSIKSRTSSGT